MLDIIRGHNSSARHGNFERYIRDDLLGWRADPQTAKPLTR